jgi:hypothetical protein
MQFADGWSPIGLPFWRWRFDTALQRSPGAAVCMMRKGPETMLLNFEINSAYWSVFNWVVHLLSIDVSPSIAGFWRSLLNLLRHLSGTKDRSTSGALTWTQASRASFSPLRSWWVFNACYNFFLNSGTVSPIQSEHRLLLLLKHV